VSVSSTTQRSVTAVVLCGGAARRFGSDKTRATLGDRPVLDHVVSALPTGWPVVCVGERRDLSRPAVWCREDPPGGGPVAALAVALDVVGTPIVVVLGGDMPYAAGAAPALVDQLLAHPDVEAVAGRDGEGRRQPLLAAYRTTALSAALPHPPSGTPLMRLLDRLRVLAVPLPDRAALDIDTPLDLERARHRLDP
jgi:molybdenum cofactor guanylyltransferase